MKRSDYFLSFRDNVNNFLQECDDITLISEDVLRKPTESISIEDAQSIVVKLEEVLLLYRQHTGLGRGLAAPQIGHSKSVFVTYVDDEFKAYINPIIKKCSEDKNIYRELCISCCNVSVEVIRPKSITVVYTNIDGKETEEEVSGFRARLLQHEIDHLNGIVNIDKAEPGSAEFVYKDMLREELRDCGNLTSTTR